MAARQTVLFTAVPRGISRNAASLPVSVVVSPRLVGERHLGAFPDWVDWVGTLQAHPPVVTLRCGANTADFPIDLTPLRRDLWQALFNQETFVRSREFDDYTEHGVISFPARDCLSALKAVYQEAGVVLALPEAAGQQHGRYPSGNRRVLRTLLDGLDVHWSGEKARQWREQVRGMNRDPAVGRRASNAVLDGEGLIVGARSPEVMQAAAVQFAVFNHMPTPPRDDTHPVEVDPNAFDFHQVLSAVAGYPALLRALGLVFDLELPADFVPATALGSFGTLAVASTNVPWRTPSQSPPLATAYLHFAIANDRYFLTASRTMTADAGATQVIGLLNLDPQRFGIAQVDFDGGMHKAIMLAEAWNRPDPARNLNPGATPEAAPHPQVFDPEATLPSLRSGGLQLFADQRGAGVFDTIRQSKTFNTAIESGGTQPRPFFAEDLTRGYRLDVWDSATANWHSLHRRSGRYRIGEGETPFATTEEEGFIQLAATQPAPGATPADKDLYIHESIARWAGWSLSVPMPGKALSRFANPDDAVPPDGDDPRFREDEPISAFKIRARYQVIPASLPRLRFGARYRMRARAVDLAGNSMHLGDAVADLLALFMALPRDPEGFVYLRYEPVIAPHVVIRDRRAVTDPGSAVDRLVIRTFNDTAEQDAKAADLSAADRHIVPPRTSVEMGERLGMFDDATGKLNADDATWQLAADRDAGEFATESFSVAGKPPGDYPVEPGDLIAPLPYLPDPLARGAALRDLPGTPAFAVGRAEAGVAAPQPVVYEALADPNPRPGSATVVSFGGGNDWQQTAGFRLALTEPAPGQADLRPRWDATNRVLEVFMPKGTTAVVPLSSHVDADGLKLLGQWQWLREYIERITIFDAAREVLLPGFPVDRIAHVLQRAVEGGHWLLTPPQLLTLVHAVQQPIGQPQFAALNVDHEQGSEGSAPLETALVRGRTDPEELGPIVAWRRMGATDAFLLGALRVHGASTAKVDLAAEWTDPIDYPDKPGAPAPGVSRYSAQVDEIPLPDTNEGYLLAAGTQPRPVGYYDPEHDQIAMVRAGDRTAAAARYPVRFGDAAPRHVFNDTKRHVVRYVATATSRYREYFAADLKFTRSSAPVVVDVPASARPLAPDVRYVIPTFGWQRQTETNLKRSVRFGGGLRVYLERGWYSSGEGELLGVALWSGANGAYNDAQREKFKPYFTQWGMDPIWKTASLRSPPGFDDFPDAESSDTAVALEESSAALSATTPGRVDVVGYAPQYDASRRLWFVDLTLNLPGPTYAPFVRLALVRYQPHALPDARISRVVLAGFAQLTPDRAATCTVDPHHPRTLRVVVSGVAPRGPQPQVPINPRPARPTDVRVRVQQRGTVHSDLDWSDASVFDVTVTRFYEGPGLGQPDIALWVGAISFGAAPAAGRYRVVVEEFEYVSSDHADAGRLIYAETFAVDGALIAA